MFLGTNLQTSKPIQTLLVSKATNEIFFLSMGCFQSYKKWQWLQVKSNALFLKISIPPSHPLQKFQFWLIHTFLLKIWLLRSPPPPTPPPFLEFPTNPWDGLGIISGTGYWQTYQLNWNYFFIFSYSYTVTQTTQSFKMPGLKLKPPKFNTTSKRKW